MKLKTNRKEYTEFLRWRVVCYGDKEVVIAKCHSAKKAHAFAEWLNGSNKDRTKIYSAKYKDEK